MLDIVGHGTLQSIVDPGHNLVPKHVLDLHSTRMDHTKCNEKKTEEKNRTTAGTEAMAWSMVVALLRSHRAMVRRGPSLYLLSKKASKAADSR